MSRDRMSMQIDIKNMSIINKCKTRKIQNLQNFMKHKKTSSDNEKHLF